MREMDAMQGLLRATGPAGMTMFLRGGDARNATRSGTVKLGRQVITFRIGARGRPVVLPMQPNGASPKGPISAKPPATP